MYIWNETAGVDIVEPRSEKNPSTLTGRDGEMRDIVPIISIRISFHNRS